MLSKEDIAQIQKKNISEETLQKQIENFKTGFPYAPLIKAAKPGDGILQYDDIEVAEHCKRYEDAVTNGLKPIKFVPASGAATRMFKALFEFINANESQQEELLQTEMFQIFFRDIKKFAFYDELTNKIGSDIHRGLSDCSIASRIIKVLLTNEGLNYGTLPKGLLAFHNNGTAAQTSLEEHLKEAAQYATADGHGDVHFTVSPEHHDLFKAQFSKGKSTIEQAFNCQFNVSFSFQKSSTDTVAVNLDNTPFRKEDGSLLFRPAGHGALIENLNDLTHELIFVKNIDNVVPFHLQADTVRYKKLLAGVLLEKQALISNILNGLQGADADNAVSAGLDFLKKELQLNISELDKKSLEEKIDFIQERLNRPIRVCGMVKNEGEPGGGPFWVHQQDGSIGLQIVEGAQIDPSNSGQQSILQNSTHFNPVDLVCYVKNYKGEKFDLTQYVDPETGFISEKSVNGKALKALELPGLWNGAMAHWLTFFVEVPITTFNPVKTVMDLLRPQHQPE